MHTFWGTYYILTWAETLFVIFPKAFLGPQLADEWKCKSTFFRLVVNYQQFNPFVWAYKGLKNIMCKCSLSKLKTALQVLARKNAVKLISVSQQSIASKVLCKSILKKLAFFAIFSFIILLWLSPDSWLSHLCGPRFDPAWFFTAGRAWMEGLVPYVDFADSKGPVLWLIYGIGYLISPTTYIGVFWQSVIYFAFSFYFVWLTARLFVNRREALLVIFLLPGMLFFRAHIIETRAEDFTFPWLFLSIYITCRCLFKTPSIYVCNPAFIRKGAFWMGFGMMYCLLIKWNIFFMMGGMALMVAGVSFIRFKSSDGLVFGLLGMGVMALPFVIYFLLTGNFDAFIKEYFVNTYLITDTNTTIEMFSKFFSSLFASKLDILKNVILVLPFLGIYAFCRRFHVSYWLIFAYVPFYFFLAFKAPFFHYCCTAVPFYVFLLLLLIHSISPLLSVIPRRAFISILAVIFIATIGLCGINTNHWFKPNKSKQEWYAIQNIMMKKEKPKFMFSSLDMGQGLLSRAVPACKYWALQSGANSDMIAERMNAIRARKPDFIVITNSSSTDFIPFIERCGYRQCYGAVIENGKIVTRALPLYAK